jgi:two-component system, NarL family, sensor histidine kinase DesK
MEHGYRFDDSGLLAGRPVERVTRYTIMAIGVIFLLDGVSFWLSRQPPVLDILLASLLVSVFLVSYVAVIWTFAPLVELVFSAVSVVAMTVLLGVEWSWLAIPVSGLAVLYLPVSRGVPAAALTTGVTAAILVSDELPGSRVATYVISAVLYSAIYYLVGALSAHSQDMMRAQGELAWEAVAEERLRFSQELHDILGHSLSVINAKTELAMRLVDRDPEAAWGEVSSLSHISRRSIADVRQVVRGYRMNSLATEIAAAKAVLAAGDVEVVANRVPAGLSPEAEEIFCWVVRSAATNILQHARARFCFMEFSADGAWTRMRVTNDGVVGIEGDIVENDGNGLPGLRQRLSQAGGTLTHGRPAADTFSIEAAVPLNRPGEAACLSELSSPRTKS